MEPPPLARFVSRKTKLRSMSGSSSSRYEPDVIEIKPPASKSLKHNQIVVPDGVIEIDEEEDLGAMLIDEKVKMVSKGKAIENGYDNSWQLVKNAFSNDFAGPTSTDFELINNLPTFTLDNLEPDPQDLVDLEEYGDDSPYYDYDPSLQAQFDAMDLPPGVEAPIPWLLDSYESQKATAGTSSSPVHSQSSSCCEVELIEIDEEEDEVLKKYKAFKQFESVEDYSDHFYVKGDSSRAKPSKAWAKKIQEEWKIMETGLPDTIFVRVCEERMDLLRAVIVGAAGTPYHDGLFFFDVLFPSNYPNVPPLVHYHSGGLRLNPNLYKCGKVCLSLLNTWTGNADQMWIPGKSTMLQVLVSIQALVLNTEPYFNEPGYEKSRGQAAGDMHSQQYSEEAFILSCRTMLYLLNRPPKNFEDFVTGHFYKHAYDILEACKAYMEGAQVGCLVKGGVQDVDEGDKSCSKTFKKKVYDISNLLSTKFLEIGAKEFMHFAPKQTKEEDVLDEF
ncbi:putative ubiquitin-conjugating enzyme E2 38 [Macadamia integrifolia]|uniref:putative ubiquitin-conjugating enzyme E2 38 n=1 Tax=Macadamia integrifolia TaxID=60698 RepID=UPI001C4E7B8B|nr:putative ubiquitin-conjugating enzyme E2 38 [Macadamia integrifolia]